jgi:CDP-paratose 2-epimerase
VSGQTYQVYGYKGKQVRDNIHSYDVIRAMEEFAANPRPGEVYNMGGGRDNSISIMEAIERIERLTGRKIAYTYHEAESQGRSHLLHQRSRQVQVPLSKLDGHTQPRRNS